MTTRILTILPLLALAGCAASQPAATKEVKMTNLLQQPLDPAFTPGREVVVSLVEIPPGGSIERHWHPGEEFHYYLEGDAIIAIDGKPEHSPAPGTAGHVPFRRLHTAKAGPRGAKVLVFRVHEQGKPVRYPETERP